MRNSLTLLGLIAGAMLCHIDLLQAAEVGVGNIEAGKIKAYTCTGCHGIPGYSNVYPTYKVPKIGGQNYQYLVSALNDYRNKQRDHSTMELQAASLSDQDIQDISAYFASLGGGE